MERFIGKVYSQRHERRLRARKVENHMKNIDSEVLAPVSELNTHPLSSANYDSVEDQMQIAEESSPDLLVNFDSEAVTASSDSDSCTSDDEGEVNFESRIIDWASDSAIPRSAVNSLLKVLRTHKCFEDFPADYRSLLKTPRFTEIRSCPPGEYCHFGLKEAIQNLCSPSSSAIVEVQLGVDGIPLFKSKNESLWPILVSKLDSMQVEVAGMFRGTSKPSDVHDYMKEVITELHSVLNEGVTCQGKNTQVILHSVIADLPARSFLLCTKNHTGYCSCSKCKIRGEWQEKVIFTETDCELRTDESFRSQEDSDHHRGSSPFLTLPIDMVARFPCEYMHLICLGVMRKLMMLWTKGSSSNFKLSQSQIRCLSEQLENSSPYVPREFGRKPRGLEELQRWKAIEFRQFLLYCGIVALKGHLKPEIFEHFLCLHVAITILCNRKLYLQFNNYAHQLLVYFVQKFPSIYGRANMTINVHCLLHLAQDSRNLGPLDSFSAFKFENKLGQLKKLVKKPNSPLQQIHRRLQESKTKGNCVIPAQTVSTVPTHGDLSEPFYKNITVNGFFISCSKGDNVVLLRSGQCIKITAIGTSNGEICIVGREYKPVSNFYSSPIDSSCLNIHAVELLSHREEIFSINGPHNMSDPNKYVVVVFKKENNVDVVPITWTFVKDGAMFSYWPRCRTLEEVHLAARDEDPPNKRTWAKYQIRVLREFACYQKAVDSVEHFMATSDYQESESSLQASFVSTPVSHMGKSRALKATSRNLSEEPDFVAPQPPLALLNSALPSSRSSKTSTSSVPSTKLHSRSQVSLVRRSENSLSEGSLATELIVPANDELHFNRGSVLSENPIPAPADLVDIGNSYVTLDVNELAPPTVVHCEGQCDEFWTNYKRFHSNILNILEKIASSQTALSRRLDDIVVKIESLKTGQDRDPAAFGFRSQLPFKTKEDLVAFSDSRKADEEKRKAFVKFLSAIGGKEVSDSCNNILKRLLIDDVAVAFSYLGTSSKLNFQSLEINSVIFDALQSNKQLQATEKAVRDRIMQFLHHAKDRLKSRGHNAHKKSQENEEAGLSS